MTDVASMRFAVGQVKGDSGTTAVNGIDADDVQLRADA